LRKNNMRDKLRKIISDSSFSEADKALWLSFISVSEEEILKILMEEIKSDARCLDYLIRNMKKKIDSISVKDTASWNNIIAEEKQFLGQA